jgi:hypothetical protein
MFFLSETQHKQGLKGLEENSHRLSAYAVDCFHYTDKEDEFNSNKSSLILYKKRKKYGSKTTFRKSA